ncbi:MAG: hypothetical protein E7643_06120 [Ruminococcaceae bacterium]|nr:hypothetical protein [Oscillospiraceae bacterium]
MNALQFLKKWLCGACVWFTAVSLTMLLIGIIFLPGMDYIASLSYLLFFPFALCMSAAGMLTEAQKLAKGLRSLLHYLITLVSFVLFLYLPSGVTATLPFLLFFFLLLSMIYWIVFGVLHMLRIRRGSTKHS